MGLQCEKTPTTRQEKVSLQRRNRVISGFKIDKGWNEKTLDNKVKAHFPEECKGTEFEFVKNVSGGASETDIRFRGKEEHCPYRCCVCTSSS